MPSSDPGYAQSEAYLGALGRRGNGERVVGVLAGLGLWMLESRNCLQVWRVLDSECADSGADMAQSTWVVILTSSVAGGVVGGIVSGFFALWSKSVDYANDYYKIVVRRRVEAYEELESLVSMFKTTLVDEDRLPYHYVFSGENPWLEINGTVLRIKSHALWITGEAFDISRRLNLFLFHLPTDTEGCIGFGKGNYQEIANLRAELERVVAKDTLSIHKVPAFLRAKRREKSSFSQINLGPRPSSAPDGAAP